MTKLGYMRVSREDQDLSLQKAALLGAGVAGANLWEDKASGKSRELRPGLVGCLKALQRGDLLCVWKLDRLGRNLSDLLAIMKDLEERGIRFEPLTGVPREMTASGTLMFQIFACFAEYERAINSERTKVGLASARARGKIGGGKPVLTKAMLRAAQAGMRSRDVNVKALAAELGVTRATIYRYLTPDGELRATGRRVLGMPPEPVKAEQTEMGA